jgi:hypothetical protein
VPKILRLLLHLWKTCGSLPKQTQRSVFANLTVSMAGGFAALSLVIFLFMFSAVRSLFLNSTLLHICVILSYKLARFRFLGVNSFVIHNYSFGFCPDCIAAARTAAYGFYSIREAGHRVRVSAGKISRWVPSSKFTLHCLHVTMEACGGAVVWGTALQSGKLRVRFRSMALESTNRNEYQEYLLRAKGGQCVGLKTFMYLNFLEPPGSVQNCRKIALPLTLHLTLGR